MRKLTAHAGARRPTRGRGSNRDINWTKPYAPKQRLTRRIKKMRLKGGGGLHHEQGGLEHCGYVGELVQLSLWPLEEDSPWNLVDEC